MLASTVGTINTQGRNGLPLEDPNVLECRRVECLSGNTVADALRLVPFPEAEIAIINGGALRTSLPGGPVTPGDILGTMPFQNTAMTVKMSGTTLLQALEHGVSKYGEGEGSFLQVSGMRYAFNPANKTGNRITNVEVLNKKGQWRALEPKASYQVVTVDFIAKGGDGYAMFKPLQWEEGDKLAHDVLRIYLENKNPLAIELEGRITIQ